MMDEESAGMVASVFIMYYLFGIRAEDLKNAEAEEVKRECWELLEKELGPFNIAGVSAVRQKIVEMLCLKK